MMRIYSYDALNWLVKGIYIKDHINLQRVSVLLKPYTHTHTMFRHQEICYQQHTLPHINIHFKCQTKTWIIL